MRSYFFGFIQVFLICLSNSLPSYGQDAQYIIDNYIKALGGNEKLESLSRIEYNYSGYYLNTPLELKIVYEEPNLTSTTIISNGITISQRFFDGDLGYGIENGISTPMSGPELENYRYNSIFLWFLNYQAHGIKLRFLQTINYDFQQFYQVEKSLPHGEISYLYFNTETGLLAQEVASDNSYEMYSNYQFYEGYTIPINIHYVDVSGELSATLTNVYFSYKNAQPNSETLPVLRTENESNLPIQETVKVVNSSSASNDYSKKVGTGKKTGPRDWKFGL